MLLKHKTVWEVFFGIRIISSRMPVLCGIGTNFTTKGSVVTYRYSFKSLFLEKKPVLPSVLFLN